MKSTTRGNNFSPHHSSILRVPDLPNTQSHCLDVQSNRTLRLSTASPSIKTMLGGTGISTCYPSPTPVGLSLGPTNPERTSLPLETLVNRWTGFSPSFATHTGILTSKRSTCPCDHASTPLERSPTIVLRTIHSFGNMFSPGTFSAQCHSTSELLRTL